MEVITLNHHHHHHHHHPFFLDTRNLSSSSSSSNINHGGSTVTLFGASSPSFKAKFCTRRASPLAQPYYRPSDKLIAAAAAHSELSEEGAIERLKHPLESSLEVTADFQCSTYSFLGVVINSIINPSSSIAAILNQQMGVPVVAPSLQNHIPDSTHIVNDYMQLLTLADLDPATAKLAIGILGPLFSAFSFLFIVRIVMSWYPKLPVGKFPYVLAYAPTEPILIPTRKLIPPLGGVDVTPVVWFGLISFLNEILVGPQGLLILQSQQV